MRFVAAAAEMVALSTREGESVLEHVPRRKSLYIQGICEASRGPLARGSWEFVECEKAAPLEFEPTTRRLAAADAR